MTFAINNKTSLESNASSPLLDGLAMAKKDKVWIRNDLNLSKSSLLGRVFWKVAKLFSMDEVS